MEAGYSPDAVILHNVGFGLEAGQRIGLIRFGSRCDIYLPEGVEPQVCVGQTTIGGEVHHLPKPFLVIATQNPVEFRGTYPLPEAQMDRFMMQCALGYVTQDEEAAILADQAETHPVDMLQSVATRDEVLALMAAARRATFSAWPSTTCWASARFACSTSTRPPAPSSCTTWPNTPMAR